MLDRDLRNQALDFAIRSVGYDAQTETLVSRAQEFYKFLKGSSGE